MPTPTPDPGTARTSAAALATAAWRREVHALYAEVRAAAAGPDGAASAHEQWVARRTELFATHPASPALGRPRLRHAPYDPAYRFTPGLSPAAPERWEAQTGSDGAVPFDRIGRLELDGLGGLDVWWLGSYGGGLFVPVRDATAGRSTYGAGRYVLDTVKGADLGRDGDRWIVDLNFAYHPSCAYDDAWSCPLAPAGNRLDATVPVGELLA